MIIDEIKKINSNKKELRKFGLTIGVILIIIGLYFILKHYSISRPFLLFGLLMLTFGFLKPVVLKPLQKVWMAISIILNFIVTNIILTLLFYLCITPISIIAKVFNKKFLDISINKDRGTYWNIRNNNDIKSGGFNKQF